MLLRKSAPSAHWFNFGGGGRGKIKEGRFSEKKCRCPNTFLQDCTISLAVMSTTTTTNVFHTVSGKVRFLGVGWVVVVSPYSDLIDGFHKLWPKSWSKTKMCQQCFIHVTLSAWWKQKWNRTHVGLQVTRTKTNSVKQAEEFCKRVQSGRAVRNREQPRFVVLAPMCMWGLLHYKLALHFTKTNFAIC